MGRSTCSVKTAPSFMVTLHAGRLDAHVAAVEVVVDLHVGLRRHVQDVGALDGLFGEVVQSRPAPRDRGRHSPHDAELGVHEVARPGLELERRRQQAVGALAAVDEDALDVLRTDVVLGDQRQRRRR